MNIEFTSAHMETLIELKQLAEEHGCRITFGVDSWLGVDPEAERSVKWKSLTNSGYTRIKSNKS